MRVEQSIYVGSQTRVIGRLSSGDALAALLPANRGQLPEPGREIDIGWQLDDGRALPGG